MSADVLIFPLFSNFFEIFDNFRALGGKVLKMCPHSVKYDSMPSELTVEQIEQEIATFERWCKVFDETIVFSHNDLAVGEFEKNLRN